MSSILRKILDKLLFLFIFVLLEVIMLEYEGSRENREENKANAGRYYV